MRLKGFVAYILTLVLVLPASLQASNLASDVTLHRLLRKGSYRNAEKHIKKLIKSGELTEDSRLGYTAELAKIYRITKKAKKGMKLLKKLSERQKQNPKVRLQLGMCLLKLDKDDEAYELFASLGDSKDHESRGYGDYEAARIDHDNKRYDECIKRCKAVVENVKKNAHPYIITEFKRLLPKAEDLMLNAQEPYFRQRYGGDYFTYVSARSSEQVGKYERAVENFSKVESAVLKDAAQCFLARSLYKSGKTKEALKQYSDFIKADPTGLYRGEALLEHAKLSFLSSAGLQAGIEQALKQLDKMETWLEKAKGAKGSAEELKSIANILKDTPAPSQYSRKHGVSAGGLNQARQVINRLSAPWYVTSLSFDHFRFKAFLLALKEDVGSMRASLQAMEKVDAENGKRYLSPTYEPQRVLQDAITGSFFLPKLMMRKFAATEARPVLLGFYDYVLGDFERAKRHFNAALAKSKKKHVLAAATLGLGCCELRNGQYESALGHLSQFEKTYKSGELGIMGRYVLANLYAGRKDMTEEASDMYAKIMSKHSRSNYAPMAGLAMAILYCHNDDNETAVEVCDKILKKYTGSVYAQAALVLKSKVEGQAGLPEPDGDWNKQNEGKVFKITDFRTKLSGYAESNLLLYRINNGAFGVYVTEMEPQIVRTKKRKVSFLRAVALSRKMSRDAEATMPSLNAKGH